MTLRQYLFLMSIGTLICWVTWFYIVGSVDPYGAGILEFVFFYASLFLAMLGTFSVIGFVMRQHVVRSDEIVFHHVKRTFRRGAMMALLLIILLFMSQAKVLTWWNSLLLTVLFFVCESIFFTQRKFSNRDLTR